MARLIGIDEAGYGPNYGPLVIAATAWEVGIQQPAAGSRQSVPCEQTPLDEIDLYELLDYVVKRPLAPQSARASGGGKTIVPVAIADSKMLYKPGGGLATLERGVLGALAAVGEEPTTWRSLLKALDADPHAGAEKAVWYRESDVDLPAERRSDDRRAVGALFGNRENAAYLVAIRARAVFAEEFNALCDRYQNKAAALTRISLELLDRVLAETQPPTARDIGPGIPCPNQTLVVCDKHGGRNRYGAALQQQFPDWLVEVRREGRAESRYVLGPADARVDVRFRKGGESFLPTALASMTAKYVRELAMRAFNSFWREQLPGLKPTAGYPVDAKRFKSEIAEKQTELGIDDGLLWRVR